MSLSIQSPRPNFLRAAILSGPIRKDALEDPNLVSRRVIMAFQVAVSLTANSSYFPIVMRVNVGFAIGDLVSFSCIDLWAIRATLEDAFGPATSAELELFKRGSLPKNYAIALGISAVAIAIFGRSAAALPALDYDGVAAVPATVVLYLQGAIFSTRSIQLTAYKVIQKRKLAVDEIGKKVELIRTEILGLIDAFQEEFRGANYAEKLRMIAQLSEIKSSQDVDRVKKYLEAILLMPKPIVADRGKCAQMTAKLGNGLILASGVGIASVMQTAGILYTFGKAKLYVTDDDFAAGCLTAISVGGVIYLAGKSVIDTTNRFAINFFKAITCRSEKRIGEQLEPLLSACLKFIGLTLNIGAFGSTYVVWGDYFKESEGKDVFVYVGGAAYFLLAATATLDLIEDAVEGIILWRGSPEAKQVIELRRELTRLKSLFEKSSLLDLCTFLLDPSDELKTALMAKLELSHQALEKTINEKWPEHLTGNWHD
jgi:hypothetical protein